LPFPKGLDIPAHYIRFFERTSAELGAIQALLENSGENSGQVLVMRPGSGALFGSRVRHFYEEALGREEALLVSTLECTSMVHPMWNLMSANRRFMVMNAIRHPRSGSQLVKTLRDICPELWPAIVKDAGYQPSGSQHLPVLHRYDGALYAASLKDFAGAGEPLPEPYPIACPTAGCSKENLLLRMPIFEMSRDQAIDVATLETVLVKNKLNGGRQL